jgi:hypothetical protein
MHWIAFDKDRYHQHREMENWCRQYIGEGGWSFDIPKTWEGMAGKSWVMHSMFGRTTFAFKEQKDFNWFLLKWGLDE